MASRFRPWQLGVSWLTLAGAITLLVVVLGGHLPWGRWLFPRYACYWLVCSVLVAAWASAGWAIATLVFRVRAVSWENALLATALGFFAYCLGWTLLGFAQLYSAFTVFAWPLCFLALGALPVWRQRARFGAYFRRIKLKRRPASLLEAGVIAFGVCATLLVYAAILTPQNVAFDGRWYHLPLGERYALMGGISRFPEGWFLAGYPQLVSILYAWVFTLPFARVFDHVELAMHVEFVVFLLTLASVPVLARRLLPRGMPAAVVRSSWVAVFLFPELFVYDSSLNGGADHVVTFWAVPIALATMRAYRRLELKYVLMLSTFVGAILLTKYTAFSLLLGPALVLGWRVTTLSVGALRGRGSLGVPLRAVGAMILTVIVLWSPVWLKNVLWYRDPLFPLLSSWIEPTPWTPESAGRMASFMSGGVWKAKAGLSGVLDTLKQLYLFSFVPNDWETFHRDWPMFGFLFTLLVPVMLVLRSLRLVVVAFWAHAGILFWFWSFHQDRYLQALVPWMSACVAVCLVWLWRSGTISRVLSVGLVGLQVVWGLDAPFFGTHMSGQPLQRTLELLAGGFAGKGEERLVAFPNFENIGKSLPPGSFLLRHEIQEQLGVGVPTVSDWFQTGISWGAQRSLADVHRLARSVGATHAMWVTQTSRGYDSYAADIHFFTYASEYLEDTKSFAHFRVGRVPAELPPDEPLQVLYLGCDGSYEQGIYPVTALNIMPNPQHPPQRSDFPRPQVSVKSPSDVRRAVREVDLVVHNPACMRLPGRVGSAKVLFRRGGDSVYLIRKRPAGKDAHTRTARERNGKSLK